MNELPRIGFILINSTTRKVQHIHCRFSERTHMTHIPSSFSCLLLQKYFSEWWAISTSENPSVIIAPFNQELRESPPIFYRAASYCLTCEFQTQNFVRPRAFVFLCLSWEKYFMSLAQFYSIFFVTCFIFYKITPYYSSQYGLFIFCS